MTTALRQDLAVKPRRNWLRDRQVRAILAQVLVVGTVIAIGAYLIGNTMENLARQRIATGWDFMGREAGFAISEHLVPYSPADTYLRALEVGLLNTALVSIIGIVLCTILGTFVGIARLSSNWLLSRIAGAYVEIFRNIPVLLQLMFWYAVITIGLPGPRQALEPVGGVFLSNRGLKYPLPVAEPVHDIMLGLMALGLVAAFLWRRAARRHQEATGQIRPVIVPMLALIFGPALIAFVVAGAPTAMNAPTLQGFNFTGGGTVTPELTALTVGLTLYTAAFVAEAVRAGILAVPKGQWEAARALGLAPGRVLRLVILPQSLTVTVPPVTSQYLNLAKNSSLAVAIGYPDLTSIVNTTINQTGQGVEGIAILMAAYLTVSLAISAFMNWYNARVALKTR